MTPLLALVACGEAVDRAATAPTLEAVQVVASPAGPGSGEPRLAPDGRRGMILSWLEPVDDTFWAVRFDRISADGGWRGARTVVARDDLFVNWADLPLLAADETGALTAFWLQRGESGGYDYGVRFARSRDDGKTWSEPAWLHDDRSPTEHGFVSTVRTDDGRLAAVWLDGRRFVASDGRPATEEMTLHSRTLGPERGDSAKESGGGPMPAPETGPETLLDGRVCDCCPTDAAAVPGGAVVIYRNRSEGEIRDIYRVRRVDGRWSDPAPVHDDGWHIEACPVNGPAVAAEGGRVAVGWFTATDDDPRVLVAFSGDGGGTFGRAWRVDGGNPVGRADVVLLEDGSAVVSWIERSGEAGAELRARRVDASGSIWDASVVAPSSGERASGFPRMERLGDGLVFAWTDVADGEPRVRVALAAVTATAASPPIRQPMDVNE